ncbi:MAG: hypothetical protein EBV06_00420 [Planctomycetia bacterium]|nr:hypothetical protein [Planctomycetia bacterium]
MKIVPVEEIPGHVKLAVLAAEDASFYEHEGLNYLGIARAFLEVDSGERGAGFVILLSARSTQEAYVSRLPVVDSHDRTSQGTIHV